MPGIVLEEPFSIARFHNVIDSSDASKQFTIGLNPLEHSIVADPNEESITDDSDLVLVAVQGEGIKLYSTADQKCIKSWTTPPGLVLGGSAIHRVSESTDYTFALVTSGKDIPKKEHNRIVWMWKNGTDNRVAKTLDERIHSMHVSPALPSGVIFVNQNGSIALMNNDLDRTLAKTTSPISGTVVWSTVFVTTNPHVRPCCVSNSLVPVNSTIILTINAHDNSSDRYAIYLHYYNEERRSVVPLVKAEIALKEKPVAFTFDPTDGRITTLGVGGKWTVWRLKIKQETGRKLVGRLDTQLSTQLQGYQLHSEKLGNVAAIAPLSEGYVAMVAPRLKDNTAEHVVSIWDVKYGTLQAERILNLAEKNACGKDKCIYKISVLSNSHLAITISSLVSTTAKDTKKTRSVTDAKSTVVLCPFYSEPISLMAAMGKMKSTARFLGIDDDSKPESIGVTRSDMDALSFQPPRHADKDDDDALYDRWAHSLEHVQKKENKSLSLLLNPTIDVENFSKTFFSRVSKKEIKRPSSTIEKSSSAYREAMAQMESKGKHGQIELSHRFVSCVVRKCFVCPNFWPLHVILYLLQIRHIRSSDIEGGIIPVLLERNEWALVPIVLESVPDIPETDLVVLLKALLANPDSLPVSTREDLFKHIIDSPHNEIFMQQALKRLTASEIPAAVNMIIWRLENVQLFESSDTFINVLEFTNGLLDSHYPVIIMEPTLYEAVNRIQELTLEHTDTADQVDRLRGMLGPFERKQRQQLAQAAKELAMQQLQKQQHKNSSNKQRGGAAALQQDEQGIPVYRVEIFNF
ncbi:hypothetical protein BDB00DRAFT_816053 [Zychaea mexicana]|uniref:uncharacterized protein n=1 Tax=Zychaea mexicana TaxID=64656 RepID=UPI0022FE55D9|nr:uncharacterized protein BDB00DRAFT_816053 [Zychaea mexicana]KAI9495131.1 hypothetical protein BDB00DRAFT_816053 [Zychaea mexicana]